MYALPSVHAYRPHNSYDDFHWLPFQTVLHNGYTNPHRAKYVYCIHTVQLTAVSSPYILSSLLHLQSQLFHFTSHHWTRKERGRNSRGREWERGRGEREGRGKRDGGKCDVQYCHITPHGTMYMHDKYPHIRQGKDIQIKSKAELLLDWSTTGWVQIFYTYQYKASVSTCRWNLNACAVLYISQLKTDFCVYSLVPSLTLLECTQYDLWPCRNSRGGAWEILASEWQLRCPGGHVFPLG